MRNLSPNDAVPPLRGDIVFSQRPQGSGAEVIHIRPIGAREGARLHGFELSLARMLDGRRTAQDVVNRATTLGLPISVPALQGFVNYLEAHSLLARTAGEAASAISPWRERVEWDPTVRLQYQAALKALRLGRVDEARAMLDRLLMTAPLLDDAKSLRSWIDLHPNGQSEGEPFRDTFLKAERGWLGQLPAPHRLPPARADALDAAELKAVQPSLVPFIVLLAIIVVAGLALFVPFPMKVSVPAKLTPVTVTPIEATSGGQLGEVLVSEGAWVNAGEYLVTYQQPEGEALMAPTDGIVRDLTAAPGEAVMQGQQLARLEDTRQLRMTAELDGDQARLVKVGQAANISLGTHRAEARVDAKSGREVVSTIDNRANRLEPGTAVVDIDVGAKSLLQRMR
jgi:hypothetical protein